VDERLTHIDLFSGIGGFSLVAGWAGFKTIAFCENESYCQEVLKLRFGGHVADSQGTGQLRAEEQKDNGADSKGGGRHDASNKNGYIPIISDIRDFNGTKYRGATLLTGGFPCQPFSVAGKRGGKEDDRYLWPEMLRVIKEAQPTWIVAENVTGIVHMALGQVLSDLERAGYDFPRDVEGYPIVPVIPASAVNAPHRRDRVWIIANRTESGLSESRFTGLRELQKEDGAGIYDRFKQSDSDASDPTRERGWGIERPEQPTGTTSGEAIGNNDWGIPWLEVATCFCRVDDGLSPWVYRHRVKRLKAIGNAIVPQVAYEIIRGIAEINGGYDAEE